MGTLTPRREIKSQRGQSWAVSYVIASKPWTRGNYVCVSGSNCDGHALSTRRDQVSAGTLWCTVLHYCANPLDPWELRLRFWEQL